MAGQPAKINQPPISTRRTGTISNLEDIIIGNPATGRLRPETIQVLLDLLASRNTAPVVNKTDISDMLAGLNVNQGYFVNVSDASEDSTLTTGWALYLYLGGGVGEITNYKIIIAEDWFKASNIDYDNTDSGLSAETVKLALDELQTNIINIAFESKWKDPDADLATTANITLSGEQTIDGTLTSSSRVLVKNQTAPAENGIYVSGAGAWTRADDADTAEELIGAVIQVAGGSVNGNTTWRQTNSAITTLGTDAINWLNISAAQVPDWSETTKGKVEKATQAEAETGADDVRTNRDNERALTARTVRDLINILELVNQTALDLKADRDQSATEGNLAEFNVNGHPIDSGIHSDVLISTNNTLTTTAGLKTIPTVNLSAGVTIFFDDNSTNKEIIGYRLRAATTAESLPNVVRPDDYAASTNEKVWERILNLNGKVSKYSATSGNYAMSNGATLVDSGDKKATQAEALAGTSNNAIMTALRVAQVLEDLGSFKMAVEDKDMISAATSGNAFDTGLTITKTPAGYVQVEIGDSTGTTLSVSLGDGVKTKDCYFSPDGGTTARAIADIIAGDSFIWCGTNAGFQLFATNRVSFNYGVGLAVGSGIYQNTYDSITDMIAGQSSQTDEYVQFVIDASKDFPSAGQGDPTVLTAGSWAEYVYLGTTNGDLTDYRKRAEEESLDVEGGSGHSIGLGPRTFETETTAPPAANCARLNNATHESATKLFLSNTDTDGADRSSAINELDSNSLIRLIKDQDNFLVFKCSGKTAETGYFDIDLTYLEKKGAIADNDEVSVEVDLRVDVSGKVDKPTSLGDFDPVGITISSSGRYSDYTIQGNFAPSFAGSGHVDFQTRKVRMSINGQAVTIPTGVIFVTNALNNSGLDFSNGDVPEIGDYEFIFDYDGVNITVVMYKATIIGVLPQLSTPTLVAESQDGQILLTLSAIDAKADTYVFEERLSPSGAWSVIHTGTDNPFMSIGLVNGTAYNHRAKVQGAGHSDSEYSTIQTTTPSTEPLTINSFTKSLTNKYIDILLGTGVYGANDGITPLAASDLKITNLVQGGVTAVTIVSITKNDNFIQGSASALTGGESVIRVWLSYTGTPNSTESFQIQPFDAASIYNAAGTAMASTETTGTIKLNVNLYELWDASEDSSVQITGLGISTMFGINGNVNLTQTTDADRPNHSPGLDEVIFDRAHSEYLIGGDVAALEKQQSDNFSIIIKRLNTNSPGNSQYIFSYKGANQPSNDPRGFSILVGGDGSLFFEMHDGTAQNVADLDGFDSSGEESFIFINNGGVLSIYDSTNTLVGQSSTSIGAISYTSLRLLLGARESATMPHEPTVLNGYWEKMAFINQALTSDQRQDLLDNL